MNLREAIHTQPMRRLQIVAVALCIAITAIDGYEILIMAFVAPHLAQEWAISPVQIGYLLSAGTFGMAIGATLLSPLADRLGRRRHVLVSLVLISGFMALSAAAQNLTQLLVLRALAGLFLGGIVAGVNTLVSEYASDKRRGTVMGIYGIGFPAGAAIGGAISGPLIAMWGWRAPFLFAAIVTFVIFLASLATLPESVEFLIERRPRNALAQYNKVAQRLRYPISDALPARRVRPEIAHSPVRAIFSGIMLRRTVFLWVGYALLTAAFYFANTWTPKLVSDATGDPQLGLTAGVLVTTGGVVGALLFAGLSLKIRPRLVNMLIMFGGAVAFVLYANNFHIAALAMLLAVFVGIFANGGIAGWYAISPPIYPARIRSTAIGLMMGFGRGVAIIAPILTGYLLDGGWAPEDVYVLFGGVLVVAGIANLLLDMTYRGRSEDPETPDAIETDAPREQALVDQA